jgi:hypothetical protein
MMMQRTPLPPISLNSLINYRFFPGPILLPISAIAPAKKANDPVLPFRRAYVRPVTVIAKNVDIDDKEFRDPAEPTKQLREKLPKRKKRVA